MGTDKGRCRPSEKGQRKKPRKQKGDGWETEKEERAKMKDGREKAQRGERERENI